ncbi:Peptide methionine sulfoxide reductase A5 [Acorus calamus]|uniref:Peptide methionine sulfoxide reductase A5 n=1 Tax=Acorus calamus TaxID=4465 RepID=A0AAV9C0D5_ACOCL|nr:Peptide methionine sulfoxide reductase A5 [Acorus calamus]
MFKSIIFTNGTRETRMAAISKEKQHAKIRSNIVTTQIQELGMFYAAKTENQGPGIRLIIFPQLEQKLMCCLDVVGTSLGKWLASKGEATDRMSVFVKSHQDKSGHAPDEETTEVNKDSTIAKKKLMKILAHRDAMQRAFIQQGYRSIHSEDLTKHLSKELSGKLEVLEDQIYCRLAMDA